MKNRPEEAAIDAIVLEVFVNPNEILVAIAEIRGVEDACVNQRGSARQAIGRWRPACAWKHVIRSFPNAGDGRSTWRVRVENFSTEGIGVILFGPSVEFRCREVQSPVASGCGRAQRFDSEEEEKLVMRNYRPTD